MRQISLTQDKFVMVDDWNYNWLNQWKWFAQKSKNGYYAARMITYKGKRKLIPLHRLVMDTPIGYEVDHIDHNGLNCQEYNMRNCTHQQNNINTKPWGKSKYMGVFITQGRYIQAKIQSNNKAIHLGSFKTEKLAAHAYDKAAVKYHGEFANLNFK